MRQLSLLALAAVAFALPAWAQRGGTSGEAGGAHGGGGGFHASFAGHGEFTGGSHGAAGSRFAPRLGQRGTPAAWQSQYRERHPDSGAYPRRGPYSQRWRYGRDGVPYNNPLGYGYGGLGVGWPLVSGWIDTNDPGYGDDGYGDDGSGDNDQSYDDNASSNVAPDEGDGGDGGPSYGPDEPDPSGGYGQAGGGYYPWPPVPYVGMPPQMLGPEGPRPMQQRPAISPAPSLYDSSAVTLIFNDGRPSEKIHNYALTRTMLYVADGKRQQIPISELNLAATEQVNQQNGVDFQLPQ